MTTIHEPEFLLDMGTGDESPYLDRNGEPILEVDAFDDDGEVPCRRHIPFTLPRAGLAFWEF